MEQTEGRAKSRRKSRCTTVNVPGTAYARRLKVRGFFNRAHAMHTVTWSNHAHFLLVRIEGATLTVRVIGERDGDTLREVPRYTPSGEQVSGPIVLRL